LTFRAARDLPASARGNWTGPRASKKARLSRQQLRRLHALLAEDWDLVEWNGRYEFYFVFSVESGLTTISGILSSFWMLTVVSLRCYWAAQKGTTGTTSSLRWCR
jgi:hypothetical protein